MASIMLIGLVVSIMVAIVVANITYKKPPLYLSSKYSNIEMPFSQIRPYIKVYNKLSEEDLKNGRFIQTKL